MVGILFYYGDFVMNIPQDLTVLSKEQLIELVRELVAKQDNLVREASREKGLKPTCCTKCNCGCTKQINWSF